jgi:hypothetical protein
MSNGHEPRTIGKFRLAERKDKTTKKWVVRVFDENNNPVSDHPTWIEAIKIANTLTALKQIL